MDPNQAWANIMDLINRSSLPNMGSAERSELYDAATGLANWLRNGGFFASQTTYLMTREGVLNILDAIVMLVTTQKEWER
jgi:hypothetical protein